jgi:hypothetical protein
MTTFICLRFSKTLICSCFYLRNFYWQSNVVGFTFHCGKRGSEIDTRQITWPIMIGLLHFILLFVPGLLLLTQLNGLVCLYSKIQMRCQKMQPVNAVCIAVLQSGGGATFMWQKLA